MFGAGISRNRKLGLAGRIFARREGRWPDLIDHGRNLDIYIMAAAKEWPDLAFSRTNFLASVNGQEE